MRLLGGRHQLCQPRGLQRSWHEGQEHCGDAGEAGEHGEFLGSCKELRCGVKDSSLRGLYAEEKEIQETFFSLQQCCELRFIELQLDF